MTYKGEIGFFDMDTLKPGDPLHGFMVENITAQSVNGVGGKYNNPSVL